MTTRGKRGQLLFSEGERHSAPRQDGLTQAHADASTQDTTFFPNKKKRQRGEEKIKGK